MSTLSVKPGAGQPTREQLALMDMQALSLRDDFKRFLFTILNDCGMFAECFHPEAVILAQREGRRGLGLEILGAAAKALGGSPETALLAILAAENKTQMEVQHGRRSNQYQRDRNRELGGDDDGDSRVDRSVDGGKVLKY